MSEFTKSKTRNGMELLKIKSLNLRTQNATVSLYTMDQVDENGSEYPDFSLEVKEFNFYIKDKCGIIKNELEAYDVLITVLMHDLDSMRKQIADMQKEVSRE